MSGKNPSVRRGVFRILAFFALASATLLVTNHLVNAGLRRIKTSSFGVSNQIMNGRVNAEILVTGSSRALTHYDSRVIQEKTGRTTYNIGINGSQTDMQLAMLKTYLRHNARPSLVIHNLDLFSFVTTGEVYDPAQYLPYLDEQPIYETLLRINPETWKWKHLPLYGYAVEDMRFNWLSGLKGFFGWNPPETRFSGFEPRHRQWTGDFERFKNTNAEGVRFEIKPEGVRDLEQIAQVCREQGVPLLFAYSPVYHEMRPLELNRAEIFARFQDIAAKFKVPIWDYSESLISSNRALFYNSQHLNADGAAAFSFDLAARLAADPAFGKSRASGDVSVR